MSCPDIPFVVNTSGITMVSANDNSLVNVTAAGEQTKRSTEEVMEARFIEKTAPKKIVASQSCAKTEVNEEIENILSKYKKILPKPVSEDYQRNNELQFDESKKLNEMVDKIENHESRLKELEKLSLSKAKKSRDSYSGDIKSIKREYICKKPECNKSFRDKNNLRRHNIEVHQKDKEICLFCGIKCSKSNYQRHIKKYCKKRNIISNDVANGNEMNTIKDATTGNIEFSGENLNQINIDIENDIDPPDILNRSSQCESREVSKAISHFMDRSKFNEIDREDRRLKKMRKEISIQDEFVVGEDVPAFNVNSKSCQFCGKLFSKEATIENHLKRCPARTNHVTRNPAMFYCHDCDKFFENRNFFKSHMLKDHGEKISNNRLQSCIVKDTKQIPSHKIIMFNKRKKKPLQVVKKNIKIKMKPSFTVVETEMHPSESITDGMPMELKDELYSSGPEPSPANPSISEMKDPVLVDMGVPDEFYSSEPEHDSLAPMENKYSEPDALKLQNNVAMQSSGASPCLFEEVLNTGDKVRDIGDLVWAIGSDLCFHPAVILAEPPSNLQARRMQTGEFEYYLHFLGTFKMMWLSDELLTPYDGLEKLNMKIPEKDDVSKEWREAILIATQLKSMDAKERITTLITLNE